MKDRKVKLPMVLALTTAMTVAWAIIMWRLWFSDAAVVLGRGDQTVNEVFLFAVYGDDHRPLNNPIGVAVARNGYIYVADADNHQVQVFYPNGRFAFAFGGPGEGEGQFNYPVGVAVAGNRVYVSDLNNHRIQVFDMGGGYQGLFPSGEKQVLAPTAITADRQERIYVVDKASQSVKVFDKAGRLLNEIGGGYGEISLRFPMGLALAGRGDMLIADSGNARLLLVDDMGEVRKEAKSAVMPRGVAVDAYGRIYVADSFNHRIIQFDDNLVEQKAFGVPGEENEQFYYPDGLAYARGRLYIVDRGNNRVVVYAVNQ
ncbi:MAG: hypothetical protein D9V47_10560 [Clostridia bacterium]|nr:MAG: hypothetical protein D9V47_10560 [Clostridia bacterium]